MSELKGCLHINEDLALTGGAEKMVRQVGIELARRGFGVSFVSAQEFDGTTGLPEFVIPFLRHSYTGHTTPRHVRQLHTVMTRYGLNLVHVHNIGNDQLIRTVTDEFPVVKSVHDYRSICPAESRVSSTGAICNQIIGDHCLGCMEQLGFDSEERVSRLSSVLHARDTMARYKLIVVPSEYLKHQLIINGVTADKIQVIPPFVTYNPDQTAKNKDQYGDYDSDVLFVGRLTRGKGVEQLMEAFSLVDRKYHMTVVGAVPDYLEPKDYPSLDDTDNRVRYTGWVDNAQTDRYYQGTKVCVIPAMMPEAFGIVGLEAMRNRKPVVAYNVGGISEWLNNGQNGILVPRGDTAGLAAAVERLLLDPDTAHEMGEKGHQILLARFTSDAHMERLLYHYRQVLK